MSVPKNVAPTSLVVYVDFDGVLHHEEVMWHSRRGIYMCPKKAPGHRLFEWLHYLQEALHPYPEAKLVLSSSWCIRPGYGTALKRLPMDIRERFIGGTFHKRFHGADSWDLTKFRAMSRGEQVLADVQRRKPARWLALDDDVDGWPEWALDNLVRCDGTTGLFAPNVQKELKEKLRSANDAVAHRPDKP